MRTVSAIVALRPRVHPRRRFNDDPRYFPEVVMIAAVFAPAPNTSQHY
jgi:hypothetical protein